MKHKCILVGGMLLGSSLLLHMAEVKAGFFAMLKCLMLAYSVVILTMGIAGYMHIKRKNHLWMYGLGVFIMCSFTLLAVDTYLFHVLTWFPGIVRYPLFSLYGPAYGLFLLPGILLYVGGKATLDITA